MRARFRLVSAICLACVLVLARLRMWEGGGRVAPVGRRADVCHGDHRPDDGSHIRLFRLHLLRLVGAKTHIHHLGLIASTCDACWLSGNAQVPMTRKTAHDPPCAVDARTRNLQRVPAETHQQRSADRGEPRRGHYRPKQTAIDQLGKNQDDEQDKTHRLPA